MGEQTDEVVLDDKAAGRKARATKLNVTDPERKVGCDVSQRPFRRSFG